MVGKSLASKVKGKRSSSYIDYEKWGGGLGYFNAHPELPRKRGKLATKAPAVYSKLHRDGDLDEAIPGVLNEGAGHALPESEVDKIARAHTSCKGNSGKASRKVGYCPATVIKYWKLRGLPIRPQGQDGQDAYYSQ
jgi:hypothetical protein